MSTALFRLVSALLFLASHVSSQVTHDASFVPDQVLRVSKINADQACTQRQTVVVNGTTPGPLLELTAGKTSWVRVYNDMTDANTTIHWHGLSQSVAPFSDGTPLASQWPIPPHHYFDYELHPNQNESGSYFYHSHVEFQAVSASGPLIVKEPAGKKPPYPYDDERIFFVTELYNRSDESIINGLTAKPFQWSGESEAVLVNGQSQPVKNKTDDKCAPEVFEVEPDKTYRFRFIGGVALADIFLVLENHTDWRVIAADAGYTKPAPVDRVQLNSGQRFDVLLKTKPAAELHGKSDYWFQLGTYYRPAVTTGYALLRYKTAAPACKGYCYTPGTARTAKPDLPAPANLSSLIPPVGDNTTNQWLEYTLTPHGPVDFPAPHEVSRRVYLTNVQVQEADTQVPQFVNNHTWVSETRNSSYNSTPDAAPYLVDIYRRGSAAVPSLATADAYFHATSAAGNGSLYTGWDPAFNAYPAQLGEVLEIVLLNEAGFANTFDIHPWHAHGGHYFDLGSGPGMYDAAANDAKLAALRKDTGYVPAVRDTTILYRWPADNKVNDTEYTVSGWRAWRIRVTDPGVWMVHCHTLQHMLMGMQTVWVMGNASEITRNGLGASKDAFETYGDSVPGDRSDPQRRTVEADAAMSGYTQFGGAAYGNAQRDAVVMPYFS